jgi:hypothetical protein
MTSSLTSNETTLICFAVGAATTLGGVTADRQADRANPESDDPTSRAGSPGSESVLYAERLWVPLWWWVAGAALAVLLAAEVHMGAPGVRAWLPYVLLLPLVAWALVAFSRLRVQVVATDPTSDSTESPSAGLELRVGKAHLPLVVASKAAVVPATAKSAALGRQLDPLAFVQHRTWVKQMVIVVLDDPDDPTPYWLISTKRPEDLLAVLSAHGVEAR